MFVDFITLDDTRPCIADPGKMVVVGKPARAIDSVLPLLNAMLPNVISYNPRGSSLVLRRQPGFITLLPNEVFITQVTSAEEGIELLNAVRDLLNQTWEHREQIQPRDEERRAPRPLDVYALLPQSNCRVCGELTCMAFAFALLDSRGALEKCAPLAQPQAAAQRATLAEMLNHIAPRDPARNLSDA